MEVRKLMNPKGRIIIIEKGVVFEIKNLPSMDVFLEKWVTSVYYGCWVEFSALGIRFNLLTFSSSSDS
jgi:hypothetical protein